MKYPKLVVVFPGILVPVNSKEEEDKVRNDDILFVSVAFGALALFTLALMGLMLWKGMAS